jgi:hypothetical protein
LIGILRRPSDCAADAMRKRNPRRSFGVERNVSGPIVHEDCPGKDDKAFVEIDAELVILSNEGYLCISEQTDSIVVVAEPKLEDSVEGRVVIAAVATPRIKSRDWCMAASVLYDTGREEARRLPMIGAAKVVLSNEELLALGALAKTQ